MSVGRGTRKRFWTQLSPAPPFRGMERPLREAPPGPSGGLSPGPSPSPPPPPPPSSSSSFFPATPSLLYRSAFAEECEALALQAAGESRWPPSRLPSTIEAEMLTPLWPVSSSSSSSWSCSFLSEASEAPSEGGGGPTAAAGPPRSPNRTYDGGGGGDSHATFLCEREGSPRLLAHLGAGAAPAFPGRPSLASPPAREKEGGGDDDGDSSGLHRTFDLDPPGLDPAGLWSTSTPAPVGTGPPAGMRTTSGFRLKGEENSRGSPGPEAAPPGGGGGGGDPPRGGGQAACGAPAGGKRAAASALASRARLPTTKKRRLSLGAAPPCPAPKGAPKGAAAAAAAPRPARGRSTGGKVPRPAGLDSTGPRSSSGGPGPSHPPAQKQLPDATRNGLTELPQEKKSAMSTQPPSQRIRKPVLGGSLGCRGPKLQGENKPPGTKLPVPAAVGGPKTGKMGAQKHPKEKEPDSESDQKQILAKRVSQGTGPKWKHTGRPLLTAGQIPRAAPVRGSCLQCRELLQENQRLAEEIQQLKTLLENCQCRDTSP